MSIKPEAMSNVAIRPAGPLPGVGVVRLQGRDCIAFAQSQFANDVTALANGQWQWNLWLSAKGRVLALFALLRLDATELLAILPDALAAWFATELLRYRFRSKVEIDALDTVSASGAFAEPTALGLDAEGARAGIERGEDGGWTRIALDFSGMSPRTLLLATNDEKPAADATFAEHWKLEDLAHGLPRLGPAQTDAYTPQMLGLERLRAFSVKKGCYPGQEIVARTHFLGQAKRGPLRLQLNRRIEPGTKLQSPEGAQADAVCVASHGGDWIEALAVAPLNAAASIFRSEDGSVEAVPLPLLDGLAR